MVALKPLLLLLALGCEALAIQANPASCSTVLGTKTVKNVPTSTTTTIKKVTIIKKVIRKVNVIVVPVAKTTTVRTTKADTVVTTIRATDTAWTTITSASTSVITRTAWTTVNTASTTITTKDVTTTIARRPDFVPIGDSDAEMVVTNKKRDITVQTIAPGGQEPQSVRCVVDKPSYSTKTITTTVQGPRRTLKAATKTKMLTISTVITSTEYPPNAKTTMTTITRPVVTSFTDTTSTTIITQTVTIESQVPRTTVYNICQDDNILGGANGGYFISYKDQTGDVIGFSVDGVQNAKECCSACAANPLCMTSWFYHTEVYCAIYITQKPTVCANNAQPLFARYETNPTSDWNQNWVFSNGPCGQWGNGGEIWP
ncbi:hypothetical protein ACLX1H_006506 [Fusarium chlamydosporum]